ncbi:MAG: hypothetical protein AB1894_11775 [Chloroflexota bacterium]
MYKSPARTRRRLLLLLAVPLLVALACSTISIGSGSKETEIAVSLQATRNAEKEATLVAQQTQVEVQQAATSTLDLPATQAAQSTTDAAAVATQKVENARSTATQAQSVKQTATAAVDMRATQQAQPLIDWIQKLANEGAISTTAGAYYPIEDLDKSVAQINYFSWWDTGYSAENFAILTDVAWDVASDKANWFNTGCGFVFADQDDDFYFFLKLSLDGMATLRSRKFDNWNMLSQKKFGKPTIPSGQANVLMIVLDQRVKLYVDDQPILDSYASALRPGQINLSLSSGINTGFGTRCQFTNAGLWIFDQ